MIIYLTLLPSVTILTTCIAFFFPAITLALIIILGQVIQFELGQLIGLKPEGLSIGFLDLRLSDPMIFGIIASLILRFFIESNKLRWLTTPKGISLSLFLAFLFFQVIRNFRLYGINTLGEFRTYYQFFIIIPYIVVSTKNLEERDRIFKLLIILSLLHVIFGIIRGSVLFNFKISAYNKWLSGFGSLALLYGLFALFYTFRENVVFLPKFFAIVVFIAGASIIIISSTRSVWLAGLSGMTFLLAKRKLPVKTLVKILLSTCFIVVILIGVFRFSEIDLIQFIKMRFLALTDYQADTTATWRFDLWMATIKEILKNPWFGTGFGAHFNVYVPEYNEVITTSSHNLYLSMLYQIGLVGLLLYLGFIVTVIIQLCKARAMNAIDRTILETAAVVLLSVHFYCVAYTYQKDFFTWSYIGLAISQFVYNRGK